MSSQVHLDDTELRHLDQLYEYICAGFRPREEWVIGTEHEKFGWWPDRGRPPDYFDARGIGALLAAIAEQGWAPSREDGHIVALAQDGATITLEPGGQLELSGAPLPSLLETEREFDKHLTELAECSAPFGIHWSGLGYMPWGKPLEMPRMPKPRYDILEKRLLEAGTHGIHMMRQTATVQANYDFSDEHDAMRKWRAAVYVQPLVTAIFAHSPVVDSQLVPEQSFRARVWLDTDDARCRLPDALLSPECTLKDYASWTSDIPMLFIHRENRYLDCRGRTFREFMKEGWGGYRANVGDYALHLSTIFPDVRLKQFLEVRGADMGSRDYVLGLPALHPGLLYDGQVLEETLSLFETMDGATWFALKQAVPREGYSAEINGFQVGALAERILHIAAAGLGRWEPAAAHLLNPLVEKVATRRCPADDIRETFNGDPAQVLERTRLI